MINPEAYDVIKKFVAVMAPPNLPEQMTAEQRCQRLIKLANLKGYECEDSYEMATYWWGNQAYFDHRFAKAIWDGNWLNHLEDLVAIDGMFERLDYIEKSLGIEYKPYNF